MSPSFVFLFFFFQAIDARIVFAFLQKTTSVMCLVNKAPFDLFDFNFVWLNLWYVTLN